MRVPRRKGWQKFFGVMGQKPHGIANLRFALGGRHPSYATGCIIVLVHEV